MLFRVYYDLYFAPTKTMLITGATVQEAIQKFMKRIPDAFIIRVEFERELDTGEDV